MLGQVKSRTRGLTLIELMVAVAIIAVMVMIALPSFQSTLSRNRLSGAAESLVQDLHLARSQALGDGCTVTVTFSPGAASSWSYQLTKATSGSGCLNLSCPTTPVAGVCSLKSVSGSEYSGVSLASTSFASNEVSFDPVRSTTTAGAAGGEVLLSSSGASDSVKVQLSAVGKVSICTSAGGGSYPAC
jgi:type IV fimbrial biogenesis protein FimT